MYVDLFLKVFVLIVILWGFFACYLGVGLLCIKL